MRIFYKHPRYASYSIRLLAHEGFFDEALARWNDYLDRVLLPEYPIKFGGWQ